MKKKVLFLLSIICLSSALYLKQGNSKESTLDILMTNVEALAQNEGYYSCANIYGCKWHPDYNCHVYDTWTGKSYVCTGYRP
ncbi:MAG: NVEALA domain-containing protein [Tannerellaceae bacterium]|nr:NVEALA domain-containing protein [Tannerellaceae bacterium]